MNNPFSSHCEQDLVSYLDGELTPRQAGKVNQHLERCPQCSAQLQDLKAVLADCGAYRQEVLVAQSPAAPQPWRDLHRDFSRIDEALANDSLLVRLMRPLAHSGAPRWSFVAGLAVLVVLLTLNQFRQAPSVQAASLLRKAVAVSQVKARPAHRIRVRTSHQQDFTRSAVRQASLIEAAMVEAVAARFEAAHFDWDDPLSARSFQQWRDQLVQKTDEVSTVQNPAFPSESLTQIRTVAAQGELAAASITFDSAEFPVEERLEFRDAEWVELSEIADASTESAGGSVANHVEVPMRATELPSRSAALPPGSMASTADEIQVLSALSAIEADLGDPVDVSISDGKVKVIGGEGISQRRQNQIRASVADIPHVAVEFTPSAPALSMPESAVPVSSAPSVTISPLQSRLEKQLGGHAEFDRFSTQLLDLDEAAMQRVYALRRLAQKFSAADEAQLSHKDLAQLHELSRKHTDVLAEKVNGMEHLLKPALTSLGGTPAGVTVSSHGNWQPAAEDVYKDARRVEVLVSQMLGMTPGDVSASALPSQLLAAMKELQGNLDDCQKLLAR